MGIIDLQAIILLLYRIDLAVAVSSLATDLIYPASYEWLPTLVLHRLWAWDYARSQGGRAQGTAAPERRVADERASVS